MEFEECWIRRKSPERQRETEGNGAKELRVGEVLKTEKKQMELKEKRWSARKREKRGCGEKRRVCVMGIGIIREEYFRVGCGATLHFR